MSTIIAFRSRPELSAQDNLRAFITSCRDDLTVFGKDLDFDSDTWDITDYVRLKSQGAARHRLIFTTLASTGTKAPIMMAEPFRSFCKAYIRYTFGLAPRKSINVCLAMLRILESALSTRQGHPDPIGLFADDFNRSAQIARDRYSQDHASSVGNDLERIAKFITDHRLSGAPIHWRNFLKPAREATRIGKEFDEKRKSKLPSAAALDALPKIFRRATETKDVVVTSVIAILCAAPDRINEVLHLPVDCEDSRPGPNREPSYALRWWPSKGADPMIKPIIPSMWDVVKEAVQRLRRISEPARQIAKWYESNPTSIYLPDHLSHLRSQEWLTMRDLSQLLGMHHKSSPHVWCRDRGIEVVMRKHRRLVRFSEVEKEVVKLLPRWFPLIHPDVNVKYSNALCVVRFHELALHHGTYLCAIESVTTNQINIPLGSCVGNRFRSIFERHGFVEPEGSPIRVSSHQFRHYLNTLGQEGGLSDVDIAKWSGRKNVRQNERYDHVTSDQILIRVRQAIGDSSQMFGPLSEIPVNLPVSRDEYGRLRAPTAHTTDFGFCIHDYTMSPCLLHRDCLHCRDHVCVKGDTVKLQRLEERLAEASMLLEQAERASQDGYAGSNRWLDHHRSTVERLTQIRAMMHDPMVPFGAVIQLASPQQPAGALEQRSSGNPLRQAPPHG